MRSHLLSATLATLFALGLSVSVHAQAPAQRAASPVAVIDITKIFKNHVRFKQQMENLRAQVEQAEASLKKERDLIATEMERQKTLKAGSPDYKALEDQILKRQATFNVEASKSKKEFLDMEAKAYYAVYQEINDAVKLFANHYGISIVLRHTEDEVNPADRQSVLKAINKQIVHLGPNMDITQPILDELNRGAPPAPAPGTARGPLNIQRQ